VKGVALNTPALQSMDPWSMCCGRGPWRAHCWPDSRWPLPPARAMRMQREGGGRDSRRETGTARGAMSERAQQSCAPSRKLFHVAPPLYHGPPSTHLPLLTHSVYLGVPKARHTDTIPQGRGRYYPLPRSRIPQGGGEILPARLLPLLPARSPSPRSLHEWRVAHLRVSRALALALACTTPASASQC
jgi:hypothetical protein